MKSANLIQLALVIAAFLLAVLSVAFGPRQFGYILAAALSATLIWTVVFFLNDYFELADGFSVVEVEAPTATVGRTLRELDLRQRFRVNLVAIKRMVGGPEGATLVKEFRPAPMPEDIIQAGDVLALVGSVLDLARFVGDNS